MKQIFTAIVVLILGLILINLSYQSYRENSLLEKSSETVISEPITKYTKRTKYGVAVGYSVDVNYVTKTGARQRCHGSVKEETINKIRQSGVMNVTYATTNPSICKVEGTDESGSWFLTLVAIVMTLGSIAYLYNLYTART